MSEPTPRWSDDDPTRISNQPALRTSSGAIWLIVGGLFTAIAVTEFAFLIPQSATISIAAGAAVIGLYAIMLLVRFMLPAGPRRLWPMAACLLGIAAISLTGVIIITVIQWDAVS